jgi:predicted enzyme related to lactoylglutathione lyase
VIQGVHALMYSSQAEALRAFFRDVLEWKAVDAGHGWLIFALPPAELAAHPVEGEPHTELYLMCDDIHATIAELNGKGVEITRPVADRGWGLVTGLRLPDGSEMGLYEPRHPTAVPMGR